VIMSPSPNIGGRVPPVPYGSTPLVMIETIQVDVAVVLRHAVIIRRTRPTCNMPASQSAAAAACRFERDVNASRVRSAAKRRTTAFPVAFACPALSLRFQLHFDRLRRCCTKRCAINNLYNKTNRPIPTSSQSVHTRSALRLFSLFRFFSSFQLSLFPSVLVFLS